MTDNFVNKITLDCLLNKEMYDKTVKNHIKKSIDKTDKKFYRKRILNLTKDLLYTPSKVTINPDIKYVFNNYIKSCIEFFKSSDTTDIIQEDYKQINQEELEALEKLNEDDEDCEEPMTQEQANNIMLRSVKMNIPSLDGFVKKTTIKKEEIFLPQQKEIDLKKPELKTKGIRKKKNIHNIYEQKNKKNETINQNSEEKNINEETKNNDQETLQEK